MSIRGLQAAPRQSCQSERREHPQYRIAGTGVSLADPSRAVVFDAGSVWLDGRADFLAEPHVGVQAALRLDQVALEHFKPITNRYNWP